MSEFEEEREREGEGGGGGRVRGCVMYKRVVRM